MPRILLLILLIMPTVHSALFNLDLCGDGNEFICFVRDVCKGDAAGGLMVQMKKGATNYDQKCDVHIMIKQYNTSSYLIRFITKSPTIKLVQADNTFFGCDSANGKLSEIKSEPTNYIKLNLTSTEKKHIGADMICELSVIYTNGNEVFPANDMTVEYKEEEKQPQIQGHVITGMHKLFKEASHRCDPGSIQHGGPNFQIGDYFLKQIVPQSTGVKCPKNFVMAFENTESSIEEAKSIVCEKKNSEWEYEITKKEKGEKVPVPSNFRAACRRKICAICSDPLAKCEGDKCKSPQFTPLDKGDCNTLMCEGASANDGKSIVKLEGGKLEIGTFNCTRDGENDPAWTFNGKPFTTATCYDKIDCEDSTLKFNTDCAEKNECPTINKDANNVTCPKGFVVEITDSSDDSKYNPKKVQCNTKKGSYQYSSEGGALKSISSTMKVSCIGEEVVAARAGGMATWMVVAIVCAVIFLIILVILAVFCIRRSRKNEEERKSLLRKNDSQPSSTTESGKPPNGRPLVQPPTTAKQTSSEQPSENTANKNKTTNKKEQIEKTVIEPTLDLNTAYSTNKESKKSKDSGSFEMNESKIDKKTLQLLDDSAASNENSKVSKKEKKDEKPLKPRKFELNEKEKKIAKGVWRKNEDYPTMADIESDWDDAKDGKPPSKQHRTATNDIPTANTPSNRAAKGIELNEKTAEMERLLDQPTIATKLQRVSGEEKPSNGESDSQASARKASNNFSNLMTNLDATQDVKP